MGRDYFTALNSLADAREYSLSALINRFLFSKTRSKFDFV